MAELEGTPLASFRSRAIAFLIDFFFALLIFVLAAVGIGLVRAWFFHGPENINIEFNPMHEGNWYSIVYYVAFVAISNYLGNGQTLGKRLMKIRAVSLVHKRLWLWHSIERALGYGASALEGGFGFLQYFIHPNRRTVHDRIAETIVVSEPRKTVRQAAGDD